MPASAPAAQSPGSPATTPRIRSLQLGELERVAAKYGFDPIPNELPQEPEPEPAEAVLRRHLAHLRLTGSVLDPLHRPRPRLAELVALDRVPLQVEMLDRYPPLQHCILCTQTKGETYTICAGCYTTQMRFIERMLLEIRPDIDEDSLRRHQALDHADYVRAIRRTPRLEPKRRARPEPGIEAVRRTARRAVVAAERAARLDALRAMAAEEGLPPAERRRRTVHLRAAEAAAERAARLDALRAWAAETGLTPAERRQRLEHVRTLEDAETWHPRAWLRALAASPLEDTWLALLAGGHAAEEEREPDDDYPVEWQDEDWLAAPDRVDFLEETASPLIPRPNTAAGGPEHLAALERNALFDAFEAARRRAAFEEDPAPYVEWLAGALKARGGIPARPRTRAPQELDAEECERWDRWVDHLLGGDPAPVPEASRRGWTSSTLRAAPAGARRPRRTPRTGACPSSSAGWTAASPPGGSAGRASSARRSRPSSSRGGAGWRFPTRTAAPSAPGRATTPRPGAGGSPVRPSVRSCNAGWTGGPGRARAPAPPCVRAGCTRCGRRGRSVRGSGRSAPSAGVAASSTWPTPTPGCTRPTWSRPAARASDPHPECPVPHRGAGRRHIHASRPRSRRAPGHPPRGARRRARAGPHPEPGALARPPGPRPRCVAAGGENHRPHPGAPGAARPRCRDRPGRARRNAPGDGPRRRRRERPRGRRPRRRPTGPGAHPPSLRAAGVRAGGGDLRPRGAGGHRGGVGSRPAGARPRPRRGAAGGAGGGPGRRAGALAGQRPPPRPEAARNGEDPDPGAHRPRAPPLGGARPAPGTDARGGGHRAGADRRRSARAGRPRRGPAAPGEPRSAVEGRRAGRRAPRGPGRGRGGAGGPRGPPGARAVGMGVGGRRGARRRLGRGRPPAAPGGAGARRPPRGRRPRGRALAAARRARSRPDGGGRVPPATAGRRHPGGGACAAARRPLGRGDRGRGRDGARPYALWAASLARRRLLLWGDPHQLGPVCPVRDPAARGVLGRSLFHHLGCDRAAVEDPRRPVLRVQHRMAPPIRRLVSDAFYDGILQDGAAVLGRPGTVEVLDSAGLAEARVVGGSRTNEVHARMAAGRVERLRRQGVGSIAVLTPYRAQVDRLRAAIAERVSDMERSGGLIGTVHSAQGSEHDAVIVDLVATRHDPGRFLDERGNPEAASLLCVALSRARTSLTLLADPQALPHGGVARRALMAAKRANAA